MGLALAELGHNEEAIWHFQQAVTTDPTQAASWANLGMLLKVERKFELAIAAYARAVAAAPADPQIRVNRAVAMLQAGRWADAWPDFEWRLQVKGAITLPLDLLLPAASDLGTMAGRTVLLTHEAGFGDTLQFLRYTPMLAELWARVLAWVPGPLVRVVRSAPGWSRCSRVTARLRRSTFIAPSSACRACSRPPWRRCPASPIWPPTLRSLRSGRSGYRPPPCGSGSPGLDKTDLVARLRHR